jgi:hypothetical protein
MFSDSNRSKAAGRGCSDFKTTVYLSGVSIVVNHWAWFAYWPDPVFGSFARVMEHFTSSLVNSRPLCHWTALRRLNLICL